MKPVERSVASADGGLGQVGGHRGPHQPVPARADASNTYFKEEAD